MKRRTLIAATAATLAAPLVRAQSLPKGPVRIIVGFPPGGGTDALARVVAQKLRPCGAPPSSLKTRRAPRVSLRPTS